MSPTPKGIHPLVDNLTTFGGIGEDIRQIASSLVAWAVAAFRDSNVDVHTEKYAAHAPEPSTGRQVGENVIAEIRGREKPDEWVLLGAFLTFPAPGQDEAYNAASVIEAARDIQITGIHPRRSIRFVLFVSGDSGSSHYVQAHRNELDRASAAIIFSAGANPVSGFALNGRHDIEAGVRESMEPIYAMGITHYSFDAPLETYSLSFLLEGIPTLLAPSAEPEHHDASTNHVAKDSLDMVEIQQVKRNTAIVAVTAFGIAELADPLGPHQSRAEIDSLLQKTSLEKKMKDRGYWRFWESGDLGRLP